MSAILTADLHLDDKSKNSDRWNLWPWLKKQCKQQGANYLIILGDMTDEKDRHSAKLVNRIVDNLYELSQIVKIIFLPGNHDFVDEKSPFFGFLDKLKNVKVIREITTMNIPGLGDCMFLPCTRTWRKEWKGIDFTQADFIFTHQSYDGCISENGTKLKGIPPSVFNGIKGKVYSGDIHVPQKVSKNIEYVGSPYRIKFGDAFKARCLLLSHDKLRPLYFPGKERVLITVQSVEQLKLSNSSDRTQIKIRYRLRKRDYPDWPKIRKEIKAIVKEKGWEFCGLELKTIQVRARQQEIKTNSKSHKPQEILQDYSQRKKLTPTLKNTGHSLLKEAQQ